MKLQTTIFVEPKGKARPRVVTKGGKTWTYTPKSSSHTENLIREQAMKLGQFFPHEIPLKVEVTFYRPKPKGLPKRVVLPVSKPDISNYLKTLEDALERFVYDSDSQITSVLARKRFGSPPRIELSIEPDSS